MQFLNTFRVKFLSKLVLVVALILPASPVQAANDTVAKTVCKLAVGYETVDTLQADLLIEAKREVINELFGELIVASTAVENFVVTSDQIRASSIGFVRVDGSAEFRNGESFAEVCVEISAYVTEDDKEKFEPIKLTKKLCDSDNDMTTTQLISYVKDEAIIQALLEFNPKLKGAEKESLLQLVQKVTYRGNGFITDTQTYCATFTGEVVPVEILAFLESDNTTVETPKSEISGVVAYFPFTGSADDISETGNDGVVQGARLAEDRFGNLGSAYYFDGNGGITIPDSSSLNPIDAYTIMAWINPASFNNTWQTILTKGPEPQEEYALFLNSGGYLHYVNNVNSSRNYWNSSSVIRQTDQWYHIAVVFDGKTIKSFINGAKTGEHESIGMLHSNGYNIEIGMRAKGNFFYGYIDDLIILNRAISDVELDNFYTEGQKHTLEIKRSDSNRQIN